MPALREDQARARLINPPAAAAVRQAALDYMRREGLVAADLAAEIGYARSTLDLFLRDDYRRVLARSGPLAKGDLYVRAALWEHLQSLAAQPGADELPRKLLRTRDTKTILGLIQAARSRALIAVVEGPPSTSKTTALRWYAEHRRRRERSDTFYLRATTAMRGVALLRGFCRQAGCHPFATRERLLTNLVRKLRQLRAAGIPPLLLVDEAQHLLDAGLEAFEQLRDVVDLAGCGCVLAGHFNFLRALSNGYGQWLEQWISRFDLAAHLRGLEEKELRELVAARLGAPLPGEAFDELVRFARVRDRNAALRARYLRADAVRHRYLSIRRVGKFLDRFEELRRLPANQGKPLGELARGALKMLIAPEIPAP